MSMNAVPSGPEAPDSKRASVAAGGGPPYDGDMDRRLTVLETRFDTILPTLATKADVADVSIRMEKMRSDLSEKIDALRVELHLALTNIMKWCVGIAMTLFIGMVGHGLYLGTQMSNLAARLPPVSPVAPAPDQPAASSTPPAPLVQPEPGPAPTP